MPSRRVLHVFFAVACFVNWLDFARAQIVGPDTIEVGRRCDLRWGSDPKPGAKVTYDWDIQPTPQDGPLKVEDGRGLVPFLQAGPHRITAKRTQSFKVFMPDPDFPDDPTKAKPEVFEWTDEDTHQLEVTGGVPPKSLVEWAGVDAKKLGAVYAFIDAGLAVAEPSTTATFRKSIDGELTTRGLADNPAVPVINGQLDKVLGDAVEWSPELTPQVRELLQRIAADLGAEPPPTTTPTTPTDPSVPLAVTYVYEKDDTAPPNGVLVGINKLNRDTTRKIRATIFEEDTVDGDGDVPDDYKVPLAAAKESGLPSLVVTAADRVVNVVKDPRTEAAVVGAAP